VNAPVGTEESSVETRDEGHLVIVGVAGETYGIDVSKVHCVITVREITRVPKTPDHIAGVINLRGKVIPVIDLAKRFGLARCAATKATRIVVVQLKGEPVGLIVDTVTDVLSVIEGQVEPPPPLVAGPAAAYIRGVGRFGERLVLSLDIDAALGECENPCDRDRTAHTQG
jgi:purine-binding chemotaxis protein CheW